ncbi:hypothetical protein [Megamonas funiformis]|uniref:hypothetical protein n=1 Tax=Megamonas funiformis TaxID=437897 RepID=UPI00195608C9|nr:hypothetical protein [Megamonas funiformis]MBM6726273.1 hypothetical protein [Megamonas funiformis]
MKTVLIIRALLVAIASFILSLYIDNPTITALTLGIIYLGFLANFITYKLITKRDEEEASYHSAHSLQ